MEPDSPASLASPASLRSLIASYVQKSAEQTENRAFKALSILQAKDIELLCLQRRVSELEATATRAANVPHDNNEAASHADAITGVPTVLVRRAKSYVEHRSPSSSPKRTRSMLHPTANQNRSQQQQQQQQQRVHPYNDYHGTLCSPLNDRSVVGTSLGIVPHSEYSANRDTQNPRATQYCLQRQQQQRQQQQQHQQQHQPQQQQRQRQQQQQQHEQHVHPNNENHGTLCSSLNDRSVVGTSLGNAPHSEYSADINESGNVYTTKVERDVLLKHSGTCPVLFRTGVECQYDVPTTNRSGSSSAIRLQYQQAPNQPDQGGAPRSDSVSSVCINHIRTSTTLSDTDEAFTSCDEAVPASASGSIVRTTERRWLQQAAGNETDETECPRCQCRLCTSKKIPCATLSKDETQKKDTIASHLQKSKYVHSHGNPSAASVHIPLLNLPQTPDTGSECDNSTTRSICTFPQKPARGTSDLRSETGKSPVNVSNNLNSFGNFVTSIIGVGNTNDQQRSEQEIQMLAEDYMKRFLDVKLIEASNMCRGMKGKSRNREVKSVCESPAPLVFSDSSSVTSKSSVLSSTKAVTDASPLLINKLAEDDGALLNDDACVEEPAPTDLQRRVIDHLMHYNHQLKTELSNLEERTRTEKALHLAELDKLQQWVDATKKKSPKALCHRSSQTTLPPQKKQNNADTQTDNQPPSSIETNPIQTKLLRHVFCQTSPLNKPDSTAVKQCENKNGIDKSCDAEVKVKLVTREVQTECRYEKECVCRPLGETELPPQWLLAAALAERQTPPFNNSSTKEKNNDQDTIRESEIPVADKIHKCLPKTSVISKSSQADFINSDKKDKTIVLQEELITSLTAKVSKLDQERHSLKDELEKKIQEERSANQKMRQKLEEKMINYCDILVGSEMTPSISDGDKSATEETLTSMSQLASSMASSYGGVKSCRMHKLFKSTSGSERLDVYAMNGYATIMKRKTKQLRISYEKLKLRIANEKKDIRVKRETQKALEVSIAKLNCDLQQLQDQVRMTSSGKPENSCICQMNDVAAGFVVEKLGKHGIKTKTQSLLARLRDANQQIITRSRAVQSLEQEVEDARKDLIAIKSRLSRSESLNQNKQLIVDNYKKRVQELENISTQITNKNTSLSSEIRVLKDTTNSMKKHTTHLQSEISSLLSEKKEFEAQVAQDKRTMEQNIKVLLKKLQVAQSEAETHACLLEEETKDKVLRLKDNADSKIEIVKQKLKQAGKRIAEFTQAIENFLRLLHKHYQQEDRDSDAGANSKIAATPANQTRALVCSILNLTHGELDNLMDDTDETRGNSNIHRKLEKWLHECKHILSNEEFSEKLSLYLFEKIYK